MSQLIANVDLSTAIVGTSGTVNLPEYPRLEDKNNTSTLKMFNESGAGLLVTFDTKVTNFLPAGGWLALPLPYASRNFVWSVQYVLPNAPVSKLFVVFYDVGERVDTSFALGNSPIGLSGTVQSQVSTLSNENNAGTTLVIDMGIPTLLNLINMFNNGQITFKVNQGGTAHTVLNTQTSGNPLQIGQTGDTTEVLGSLLIDQFQIMVAGNPIEWLQGSTFRSSIQGDTGGTITYNASGSNHFFQSNSTQSFIISNNGSGIQIGRSSAGDAIDQTSSAMYFKSIGGAFSYQHPNGTTVAGFSSFQYGLANLSGGTATVNHGLGGTPSAVIATPVISQPGSATVGVGSITSTQFTVTTGAGTQVYWFAIR